MIRPGPRQRLAPQDHRDVLGALVVRDHQPECMTGRAVQRDAHVSAPRSDRTVVTVAADWIVTAV
jgi:hypothetical protein